VCVCVCVCVYTYIYIYTHTFVCVCVCKDIFLLNFSQKIFFPIYTYKNINLLFDTHLLILNFLNENLSVTDSTTLTSEQARKLFCNFLWKGFPALRDFLIIHCVNILSLCMVMLWEMSRQPNHPVHIQASILYVCLYHVLLFCCTHNSPFPFLSEQHF